MTSYRRKFSCEVVTPDGPLFETEALSAVLPGEDGQIGILGNRSPAISLLGAGPMELAEADGPRREYYVAGGYLQVHEAGITVLAEECVALEDLDREAAWEQLQAARGLPTDTDEACARRDRAVHAARVKFRLAQRHWRRTHEVSAEGPEE